MKITGFLVCICIEVLIEHDGFNFTILNNLLYVYLFCSHAHFPVVTLLIFNAWHGNSLSETHPLSYFPDVFLCFLFEF